MKIDWQIVITALGVLGTPLGFFLGQKERKAKTKIVEGDAIQKMQGAYDTFVEDQLAHLAELKKDYNEVKVELRLLRKENIQQREEIRGLKSAQKTLIHENSQLKEHVNNWEKKYNSLKRAFDDYKKARDAK